MNPTKKLEKIRQKIIKEKEKKKQREQKAKDQAILKAERIKLNQMKEFNHLDRYKWFKPQTLKKWIQKIFDGDETILINMELENGMHNTFMVKVSDGKFEVDESTYIIDLNLKYFNTSAKMYCLDYHQAFSIPLKRKFDIPAIQKAIKNDKTIECSTATNPSLIKRFMDSSIISKIFEGASLENKIQMLLTMSMFALGGIILCLMGIVYTAYQLGLLQPQG